MPVDFSTERWARIRENSRRWWAGQLKRPLIHQVGHGRDPGRPAPRAHPMRKARFYDFSLSADDIVDGWDYRLSSLKFLGDSFPCVWPDFGPGVLAAYLGARTEVRDKENTVWFGGEPTPDIARLRFAYRPDAPLAVRLREIYRAALRRWNGLVQLGMTDLGGNLDVLASFRPGEQLLLDLSDSPREVERLTWEAHEAWFRCFEDFDAILRPVNPGHTAWTPIFSGEPYYMLQCDFAYMISPQMFDKFVRPELAASCRRLVNPFYHLDGKGQLPHLDSLLSIPELKGVQWIPGDGQPGITHWPHVYRKIRAAGKLTQIFGGPRELDTIADQLGSAEGIIQIGGFDLKREKEMEKFLSRYGALE